jgi:hypothetical protein
VLQSSKEIADFYVTVPHKVPEGATNASCKVSFELDLHGLVRCTQATHCHKIEVEEPAAAVKTDTTAEGGAAANAEGENGDASNMDTDPPVGPPAPEDAKSAVTKKQKKVCHSSHVSLLVDASGNFVAEPLLMSSSFQHKCHVAQASCNSEIPCLESRSIPDFKNESMRSELS